MSSSALNTAGPAPAPATQQKVPKLVTWNKDCAVMLGDSETAPIFAGSRTLGSDAKIQARLTAFKTANCSGWLGFRLNFPLPENQAVNENAGFGVIHHRKLISGGRRVYCHVVTNTPSQSVRQVTAGAPSKLPTTL